MAAGGLDPYDDDDIVCVRIDLRLKQDELISLVRMARIAGITIGEVVQDIMRDVIADEMAEQSAELSDADRKAIDDAGAALARKSV